MLPTPLLLATLAHAVAPSTEVYEGIEPQRLHVTHAGEQGRLLASPEWRAFGEEIGWTATFDETTGTPRWAWGAGVAVDTSSEAALGDDLLGRLAQHPRLFGFAPGTLRVRSAEHDTGSDTWYVEIDALRAGLPTYGGGISARIKHGNLVALKVATAPSAEVTGSLALSAADAVRSAITAGPAPLAAHTDVAHAPMLLERRGLEGFELRVVWQVTSRTKEPVGHWVSMVDAETGELLEVWNEVRFANGTLSARHHRRTVDGSPLISSPLPLAVVHTNSAQDLTDDNGDWSANGSGPYRTDFDGDYLRVLNQSGGEGSLSSSNTTMEWTTADATQAEIDVYKFVHDVKAWGDTYAANVGWVANPVLATVNLGQTCNAYWDGDLNFFSSGGGCNNTAQIADVVYHEWGHGFHNGSLRGGRFDGSLSEGAGDTVAILLTQDPNMSPYFNQNNPNGIRNLGPNRVYPRDIVREVHEDGLIFGGAMFDLMNLLQDDLGTGAGTAVTSEIFAGLLKGGPTIPDSYNEALVADDDDGNLQNGTPHVCQIDEAFGQHGLGAGGGSVGGIMTAIEQVEHVAAGQRIPVSVELVSVSAGCEAVRADEGTLHWRVAGGSWETSSMSNAGTTVEGEIPGQPTGTIVEYYVTGEADGEDFEAPSGGIVRPFTAMVGDVIEIKCHDFEQNDGGFTHELVSGQSGDGADDWQWGAPAGLGGDPSGAFSGNKVWGNDLGFGNYNGTYQPDKHNRLTSGTVDTGWYTGVALSYRRWLGVEDSTYDRASIRVDGDVVWDNYGSAGGEAQHVDGEWVSHVVDLGGRLDQGRGSVSFDLETDGGLEFGGWTLDDVCFVAPATTDNKMGIVDLRVDAVGDTAATLSWTQPQHGPVRKIRVVRRTDRMPEGAEDGQIAYEADDVQPGAPFSLEDANYHAGTTYYAVYGNDGDGWLSWTVEGWNAGAVELVGGRPPEGVMTEDGMVVSGDPVDLYRSMGCGCDGSGVGAGAVTSLASLLVLAARRRR